MFISEEEILFVPLRGFPLRSVLDLILSAPDVHRHIAADTSKGERFNCERKQKHHRDDAFHEAAPPRMRTLRRTAEIVQGWRDSANCTLVVRSRNGKMLAVFPCEFGQKRGHRLRGLPLPDN